MTNWQTNYGKDALRKELRDLEATFEDANLKWDKINRQKEDALAVTVDIIKRQVRRGLITLKPQFSKEDELYQSKESSDENN